MMSLCCVGDTAEREREKERVSLGLRVVLQPPEYCIMRSVTGDDEPVQRIFCTLKTASIMSASCSFCGVLRERNEDTAMVTQRHLKG